jgi:hypothetical protein
MFRYVFVSISLLIAGCVTQPSRDELVRTEYGPRCEVFGHVKGSNSYYQCIQDLITMYEERDREMAQRAGNRQSFIPPPAKPYQLPAPYVMPTNKSTNTNCTLISNQMYCNTY